MIPKNKLRKILLHLSGLYFDPNNLFLFKTNKQNQPSIRPGENFIERIKEGYRDKVI